MVTRGRRGSTMLLTILVMMVVSVLGAALMALTSSALARSRDDKLRAQALDAAEAGVEKAVYYLRGTAPDGSSDGSWRVDASNPYKETLSDGIEYSFFIDDGAGDDAGKIVVDCTGRATQGARTARRRLRVVLTRADENISVWNNVIFGGVGQAGRSIQGNVKIRGNVHLLGDGEPYTDVDGDGHWDNNEPHTDLNGNGQWDSNEPFEDRDGDGRRDAREPFIDMNGNGTCDPPLTVTELAAEFKGTAEIGNNYSEMSPELRSRIPSPPKQWFDGEYVESLSAKLRVKHGRVNLSGTATVGDPHQTGGSPPIKETMNGTYVNDGWGGNQGSANVYSDNGTNRRYDLGDLVKFPDLLTPTTIDGVTYDSHMEYLRETGLRIDGNLTLYPNESYDCSDNNGNSIRVDGNGNIEVRGIVYVHGNISLARSSGNAKRFTYTGRGTLVSTGNITLDTDLLPASNFPQAEALGMIARRKLYLGAGSGSADLKLAGAFYAQEQVISEKQSEVAGSFVASHYAMNQVPSIYQVPELVKYLPPGMPGSRPIWIVRLEINSSKEIAP